MLFYQQIVPLNDQTHARVRMKPLDHFRFALRTNSVPILAGEFAECARCYPIVFATGEGGLVPMALLGLREAENLFVSAEGKWLVPYVPAFVRRYPFVAARGSNGQVVVCFDELAACSGKAKANRSSVQANPARHSPMRCSFSMIFRQARRTLRPLRAVWVRPVCYGMLIHWRNCAADSSFDYPGCRWLMRQSCQV